MKTKKIELDEKETTILTYLAGGYIGKEIAKLMGCSEGNIRRIIYGMCAKTGAFDKATLIAWGFRNKILK